MSAATATSWLTAALGSLAVVLAGCAAQETAPPEPDGVSPGSTGPHGGRLLRSGGFELELAIANEGDSSRFRAWASSDGVPVPPREVALAVELTRLGNRVERFSFEPRGEFLQGAGAVAVPHSFSVSVEAVYQGAKRSWDFDSFQGRTRIGADVAEALGVVTAVAGPARLTETISLYGRIRADPERVRRVWARFDGVAGRVHVHVGSRVQAGDRILTIESDESLSSYELRAPIGGVVTQRDINPGEHTAGRLLLTITDTSRVWADLSIFPGDRGRVRVGNPVSIVPTSGGAPIVDEVEMVEVLADADQAVVARAVLGNDEGRLLPGVFVRGDVTVDQYEVPLAVRKTALQTVRGLPVVYARAGDVFEMRILELGRQDHSHAEVRGGLDRGTRYVVENSHLIKADLEKSSADHGH